MGGGGGSSKSSQSGWSKSQIEIPEELKPLYKQSADYMLQLQNLIPLWGSASQPTPTTPAAGPTTTPATTGPKTSPTAKFYTDATGKLYSSEQVAPTDWGADTYFTRGADGSMIPVTPYSEITPATGTPGTGGTPGTPTGAGGTTGGTPNFLGANAMQIAGTDPLQAWAAEHATSTWNTPEAENIAMNYGLMAPILAGRMATGAGVATDPAVLAASEAFEKLTAPAIQNQMGLSGLGRSSSLANSLALAKSSYMMPLIQDYINREQQTLQNQAGMYASMVPQFTTLGTEQTSRQLQALNAASQLGGTMRSIAQEPLTAQYQDFLRRQALGEQALFVPFGATATASIGPKSESQYSGTSSSQMQQGMK